jgi:hypothetical protein
MINIPIFSHQNPLYHYIKSLKSPNLSGLSCDPCKLPGLQWLTHPRDPKDVENFEEWVHGSQNLGVSEFPCGHLLPATVFFQPPGWLENPRSK